MRQVRYLILIFMFLAGCGSFGNRLPASGLQQIKVGVTTRQQMITWFGSPMSQTIDVSGKITMTWYHNEVTLGYRIKQQNLTALFNEHDIVERYSLIDDVN